MKKVIVILMCLGMLFSCTVPSYSSFLVLNEEKQKESVEKDEPPVEETSDTEKKESVPEKGNPAASENSEKQDVPAPEEKKESSENAGTETESGNEVSNVTEVKEPEHKEEDVKSESENHGNSQVVEKTEVNETPEKPEGSESVVKPEVLPNPEISNSPENGENPENKDVPESQETEKKEESPEYVKPATKKRKFRKRFWKKECHEKKETEQAKDVTESEKDPENEAAGSETPPVEEKTEEKEPVEETGKTESKEDSKEESKEEKSETEKESQTEEIPPEVEPSEKEENGESETILIPEKETGESVVPENSGETEVKDETEVKEETEAPENPTEKKDSENQTAENETPAVQEKNEKEEPAPETPKETEGAESGEESVEHEVPETSGGAGEHGTPETSGESGEHGTPETSGESGEHGVPETSGGAGEHGTPETSGGTGEHGVPETSGGSGEYGAPETSGGTGEHEVPETSGGTGEHGVPETSGGAGESGAPEGTEGTVVSQETAKPEIPEVEPEPVRRKSEWTTVIYMAADNDLEIAAIQDINEIEAAGIDDEKMTVLVLIDRAEGYDFTNDDWTDTRLLKIVKDPSGLNGTIVSERLDCPDLDLYKSKNTELDMGNSYTLSALLNFARREYEAEHYALILWGHGTGWRAADLTHPVNPRAVGIDDKTGTYLSVPAFADAVHEKDLDVIAYDTCFGSVIENLYEIRDESRYVVGAAGITPSCGFNYSDFINDFVLTDLSVETFVLALSKTSKVPVTITDCTGIKRIADAVNAFGKALADSIVTPSDREREFEVLFRKTKSYISSSYPCDMFLDLYDMAEKYITEEDDSISEKAEELRTALKLYTRTTGSQNPEVGINFIPMYKKGVAATAHSPEYFQQTSGSFTGTEKSQFVQEMGGWVPTRKGISLLDKLFYSIF